MATFSLSCVPSSKTSKGSTTSIDIWRRRCHLNINGAFTATKLGQRTKITGIYGNGLPRRSTVPSQEHHMLPFRRGLIISNSVYRSRKVVQFNEGRSAPQTILNHLQDTALKHQSKHPLVLEDGSTPGMLKNNLIWVISRMQLQVVEYPISDLILDTSIWVDKSGDNAIRREGKIRSYHTGEVVASATSTWVMVNKKTRQLSEIPDEVKAEISPWFTKLRAIESDCQKKLTKLDVNARYGKLGLQAMTSDLDMNHNVSPVTYSGWVLEAIPNECLKRYELSEMILEYKKECKTSDMVQSFCEPKDMGIISKDVDEDNKDTKMNTEDLVGLSNEETIGFTHVLQVKGESESEEIVRGETTWKKKAS